MMIILIKVYHQKTPRAEKLLTEFLSNGFVRKTVEISKVNRKANGNM